MFANFLVPAYFLMLVTFMVMFIHMFATIKIGRPDQVWAKGIPLMPYATAPDNIKIIKNSIQNLFEMPVLYYVMTIFCFIQGLQDQTLIMLSWGYLLLRIIHTGIHLFSQNTMARGLSFVLSNLVLLGMLLGMMRTMH
ncbi:MAG TPA: hypothetical protein DCX08_13630 [Porticoccaceae bacterium]|jgi:hypothetical protein|nr:hypothetical protein [Porticoccaceae bacterium]